jgi:phthalate 4,5-cis-dihydrodiol dehydrogenase
LTSAARLRVGIVGLGAAGQAFIPALLLHPGFEWAAGADADAEQRQAIAAEHRTALYATLPEMLAQAALDAVYVATPTALHAQQVLQAAAAGKHVLVEKPMAVTLDDAQAMVAAADAAGVVLAVGHSHSHDLPIRRMREIIETGDLGAVQMAHTWCFSDWVYRPRRADELDEAQGGGVSFRQGSHQFDVLRLLCGGRARSVRAKVFDWDPARRVTGAHTVFIDFEDGPAATAVYNGYGGLSSVDLCFDISEWGFHQPPGRRPRAAARPGAPGAASPAEERVAKQARARTAIPAEAPFQPFFGLTVVSCARGDIRQSPQGLLVHDAAGTREITLPADRSPRELVLDEWCDAIHGRAAAVHDGRWGLANLELVHAALASSRGGCELRLQHQVPVRR